MKIVNLTPHSVTLINPVSSNQIIYPASGMVARIGVRLENHHTITDDLNNQIPLVFGVYGDTLNLPISQKDTYFIVSALVRTGNSMRKDLISPSDLVRDEKGNIIGCKSFEVNP